MGHAFDDARFACARHGGDGAGGGAGIGGGQLDGARTPHGQPSAVGMVVESGDGRGSGPGGADGEEEGEEGEEPSGGCGVALEER